MNLKKSVFAEVVFSSAALLFLNIGTALAGQAGCDGGGGGTALSLQSIQSGGVERTYLLQVPPQHDGSTPLPVILDFHGMGSNASDEEKATGFASRANRDGFVLVVPQGIGNVPAWNSGGVFSQITKANDVQFVRDMLDRIGAEYCTNPARVFATGVSNGGGMVDRLGCEMPDRVVAIAPVSGAYTKRPKKCSKRRKVSVIEFHGDKDKTTPYKREGSFSAFIEVPSWLRNWARRDGCRSKPKRRKIAHNLTKETFSKCAKGAAVEHYRVHGGGHSWFGSPVKGTNVKTTARIWNFFKRQAKK